jgi:hypothetical protein
MPPYIGIVEDVVGLPQFPEAQPPGMVPWAQFPPAQPGPDIIMALPSTGMVPETG